MKTTQLEQMNHNIDNGDSSIEAYNKVDLELMGQEGNADVATEIREILNMIDTEDNAGI